MKLKITSFNLGLLVSIITLFPSCAEEEVSCDVRQNLKLYPHVYNVQEGQYVEFTDSSGNIESFKVIEKIMPQEYTHKEGENPLPSGIDPLFNCHWAMSYRAVHQNDILMNVFYAIYNNNTPNNALIFGKYALADNTLDGVQFIPEIKPPENMSDHKTIVHFRNYNILGIYFDDVIIQKDSSASAISEIYVSANLGIIGYRRKDGRMFRILIN